MIFRHSVFLRMRWLLIAALLCGLPLSAARADALTDAKARDIRHLMELTGAGSIALQFAAITSQNMFRMLKNARPEIPDRAVEIMQRELIALFRENMEGPSGLLDRILPIYAAHFTHLEIRQLIEFYETPIGRKTILVMPQVVNESSEAGKAWGESLGPEIERRIFAALKREHIQIE